MKRFYFLFVALGCFISSHVFAMDGAESSPPAGAEATVQMNRGDTFMDSQVFLKPEPAFMRRSLVAETADLYPQTVVKLRTDMFASVLDRDSLFRSTVNERTFDPLVLDSFSALPSFEVRTPFLSLNTLPLAPLLLEPRPDFLNLQLFVAPPPKPIIRAGIILPKVDLDHLGISDFFKSFGIFLGNNESFLLDTASLMSRLELIQRPPFHQILLPDALDALLRGATTFTQIALPDKAAPLQLDDLTNEQIILLFKRRTSCLGSIGPFDREASIKLEDLLKDGRARQVILEASKSSNDLISEAIEETTLVGDLTRFKDLLRAEGFIDHLVSQPVNEKGETVLSKIFFKTVFLNRPDVLSIILENRQIFEHLRSIPDAKYQSIVLNALMAVVILPGREKLLPVFYESDVVFDHLVSCFSRGDAEAQAIAQAYTKAGLLMALSQRASEKVDNLLHGGVVRFIQNDAQFAIQVVKKAVEERNSYLARKLLTDPKLAIPPAHIKEAIEVSEIWEKLDDESKQILLARAQTVDPYLTEERLIGHHQQTRAYEHAIVGHPLLGEDMETFKFEGLREYREVLEEGSPGNIQREVRKKALERGFLKRFSGPTVPWFHAETEFAYDLGMFGQDVNALVVELDVLPEHHREGLLRLHLGEQTSYKEQAKGERTLHNIGVTSLVAQMAPLAIITSISTGQLHPMAEDIKRGRYPFINCSWSPCAQLTTDTSSPFSIFSSHQELNSLLGAPHVVLVQAAGNEGGVLSNPESMEDVTGKVFSRLLSRLKQEQTTNLILAVNLNSTNRVAESSNIPGDRDMLYRMTLSAQGSYTFWLDETGCHHRPLQDGGTSSAAPIVMGAALLVQSYKPDFSPVLIRACLLHSAQREFPIYDEGRRVVRGVYETSPSAMWTQEGLPQEPYSFSRYGMGVLSVPAAIEYVDVLDEHLKLKGTAEVVTFEELEMLRAKLPSRRCPRSAATVLELDRE